MELIQGFLGGSHVILPPIGGTLTETKVFDMPIAKVVAVLTGFNLSFVDGDKKLLRETVILRANLHADKKTGEVMAEVALRDGNTSGDIMSASLYYTLIGE